MRNRPECAVCGDAIDLSYIHWDGEALCTQCFAEAVADYAQDHPFLLAHDLGLHIIHVPED